MADLREHDATGNPQGLLNLHNLSGGMTAALQAVEDGFGVASALSISTEGISVVAGASYMYDGDPVLHLDSTYNNYNLFGGGNTTMTGRYNIFIGPNAGNYNDTGIYITSGGFNSTVANIGGTHLTAWGYGTLRENTYGEYNGAFHVSALASNEDGNDNLSGGYDSLRFNISGNGNVAWGNHSQEHNLANYNSSLGTLSFDQNTTGYEVLVAGYAGARFWADGTTILTTAKRSVYLGALVRGCNDDDDNVIVIGHGAIGLGVNQTVIGTPATLAATIYGALKVQAFSDSSAPNLSLYNSTTSGKLSWKEDDGTIKPLYA